MKVYIPALTLSIPEYPKEVKLQKNLPHGCEYILIVDDEDIVRAYTEQLLFRYGYHISSANSAEQALSKLETEPKIELILVDLMMPGIGGKKMVEKIAEDAKITAKIIMTSGYSNFNITELPFKSRVQGFLNKPFTTNDLLTTIRSVLDDK